MSKQVRCATSVCAILLAYIICQSAWGMGDLGVLLDPKSGREVFELGIEHERLGAVGVDHRPGDLGISRYRLALEGRATAEAEEEEKAPASEGSDATREEDLFGVSFRWIKDWCLVDGSPKLRNSVTRLHDGHGEELGLAFTGLPLSESLTLGLDLRVDLDAEDGRVNGFRNWFRNAGWLYGGEANFECGTSLFLHGWTSEESAWFVGLDADTRRHRRFVPAVGYCFPVGENLRAAVGIPMGSLYGKLTDRIAVDVLYGWPEEARAHVSYILAEKWRVYTEAKWDVDFFSIQPSNQFVIEEKRVALGLEWHVSDWQTTIKTEDSKERIDGAFVVTLEAGHVFGRSVGEGGDRHELQRQRLTLDDTWFVGLGVKASL